ncbi:MAG: c-type cytochrome [Promethearchaeota archaeon]
MRRLIIFALISIIIISIGSYYHISNSINSEIFNSPTPSTSSPNVLDGEELFKGNCVVCHGEKRMVPLPEKPGQAPTLSAKNVNRTVIEKGRPEKGMPSWSNVLTPDEITAIVAYLKS